MFLMNMVLSSHDRVFKREGQTTVFFNKDVIERYKRLVDRMAFQNVDNFRVFVAKIKK